MYLRNECANMAQYIKNHAKGIINKLKDNYDRESPKLLIVTNDTFAGHSYVKNKVKACNEVGIDCIVESFESTDDEDYYERLKRLHQLVEKYDDADGIIFQQPLTNDKYFNRDCVTLIPKNKDVDGLNHSSWDIYTPATALGIYTLLKHFHYLDHPVNVTIIGRSELVGKPLAHVLNNEKNVSLQLCNSTTKDVSYYTKNADVIICAVGKKEFLTKEMVKPNAIVIDVGINRNDDGKLCGDVHKDVAEIADVTPVPKGVGLLTVASLVNNVATAYSDWTLKY